MRLPLEVIAVENQSQGLSRAREQYLDVSDPKLDSIYRAYLFGKLRDREFSRLVDELISLGAASQNLLPTGNVSTTERSMD